MPAPLLSEDECRRTLAVLAEHGGNQMAAARALGIAGPTLRNRLDSARRRGLTVPEGQPSAPQGAPPPPTPREARDAAFWQRRFQEAERARIEAEHIAEQLAGLRDTSVTIPNWLLDTRPQAKGRSVVGCLISDVHMGEVIAADEIQGVNAFDPEIARRRLERYFQAACIVGSRWASDTQCEGALLALAGDLISGDIHEELIRTNALTSHEQVAAVVECIVAGIRMLADQFGRVHVVGVPGNHGRCYDADTEVLTEGGWKFGLDVDPEARIAIYDPGNDELIFERPSEWYRATYCGDMIRFKNSCTDLLITPEHTLWARRGWNGQVVNGKLYKYDYKKIKANESLFGNGWSMLAAPGLWRGTAEPIVVAPTARANGFIIDPNEDWASLFGWYVSEGNVESEGRITISQSRSANPEKYAAIVSLLKRLNFLPREYDKTIRFGCAPLAIFLKEHFGGVSKNKTLPIWLRNWPTYLLEEFMVSAMDGDGYRETPSTSKYTSTSDSLIDHMQEIAIKLGYSAYSGSKRDHGTCKKEGEPVYHGSARRLHLTTNRHRAMPNAQIEVYSGPIWCPTVSTGLLFVRRNGRVVVSGNTTHKPTAKLYARLSYDIAACAMIARFLEKDQRVSFSYGNATDQVVPILGRSVLVTHGDKIGTRGGMGFAGPNLPIVRGVKKVVEQQTTVTGSPPDLILMGHYHTTSNPGIVLANGSVPGYSEFGRDIRAAMEPPQQWLFLMHSKWGLRERAPIQLEDPRPPPKPRVTVPARMG